MRGMWNRSYGRATKAPPDERGGNRHAQPTATAPHPDSTHDRLIGDNRGVSCGTVALGTVHYVSEKAAYIDLHCRNQLAPSCPHFCRFHPCELGYQTLLLHFGQFEAELINKRTA